MSLRRDEMAITCRDRASNQVPSMGIAFRSTSRSSSGVASSAVVYPVVWHGLTHR
jgi:hypothetical protein